jgi:hypothetical protein
VDENHLLPMTSTDEGTMISTKPVIENTARAIRDNLDPDSNVIEESDLHSRKKHSINTSTDARPPVRDNLDPDSNGTEESDLSSEKQPAPKNTTELSGVYARFSQNNS